MQEQEFPLKSNKKVIFEITTRGQKMGEKENKSGFLESEFSSSWNL